MPYETILHRSQKKATNGEIGIDENHCECMMKNAHAHHARRHRVAKRDHAQRHDEQHRGAQQIEMKRNPAIDTLVVVKSRYCDQAVSMFEINIERAYLPRSPGFAIVIELLRVEMQ